MIKKIFKIFIFICFVQITSLSVYGSESSPYKVVYLLSGPRALSTVFLRMMESRGDFVIFHEPTIPVYDQVHYAEITKGWFRKDAFSSYKAIKEEIVKSQQHSHVFIKDMSFSSCDYITQDENLMRDPSVYFVFLVRDPHQTSISFYLKMLCIVPRMSDLIGLEKLYKEYTMIKKRNPNGVKIIFSHQLYQKPRPVQKILCQHLGIPFTEKAFCWKKYDEHFQGHTEWNEQKVGDHIHHWHGRAIQSEHIEKPRHYQINAKGNPTFQEIINKNDRKQMRAIYQENLLFYQKFIAAKQDHLIPLEEEP